MISLNIGYMGRIGRHDSRGAIRARITGARCSYAQSVSPGVNDSLYSYKYDLTIALNYLQSIKRLHREYLTCPQKLTIVGLASIAIACRTTPKIKYKLNQ